MNLILNLPFKIVTHWHSDTAWVIHAPNRFIIGMSILSPESMKGVASNDN